MASIFSDDFESGDVSAWDGEDGDQVVNEASVLVGIYGMSIGVAASNSVRDDNIGSVSRYRARFYFDPNSANWGNAGVSGARILLGRSSGWGYNFNITLYWNGSSFYLVGTVAKDVGEESTANHAITDVPHYVEIDWKASSGVGQNDGYFKLWIDGVLKETIADIDNDTWDVDHCDMGHRDGWGTRSGTLLFDAFVSDNADYIGPAGSGPANLKSVNGVAKASIKSINGVAIANIKSINGVT